MFLQKLFWRISLLLGSYVVAQPYTKAQRPAHYSHPGGNQVEVTIRRFYCIIENLCFSMKPWQVSDNKVLSFTLTFCWKTFRISTFSECEPGMCDRQRLLSKWSKGFRVAHPNMLRVVKQPGALWQPIISGKFTHIIPVSIWISSTSSLKQEVNC